MSFDPLAPRLAHVDVERIFDQLHLVYGKEFSSRWRDSDIESVKDDWAVRLAWCSPQTVDWALANLPERAPNVVRFEALCRQAPSQERVIADFEPPPEPPDAAQRARIHALCAATFRRIGMNKQADESAYSAAVAAEQARDAGLDVPADLMAQVEAEIAQAREKRISKVLEECPRKEGRFQFNLDALLRRQGTEDEQSRDWARIVAAKFERGCAVGEFAKRKAREALAGREREDWLNAPPPPAPVQKAAPTPPTPAPAAPAAQDEWFDAWAAEELPL